MKLNIKKKINTILKILSFVKVVPKTMGLIYSFNKLGIIGISLLNLLKAVIPIASAFVFGNMITMLYLKDFDKIVLVLIIYVFLKIIGDLINVWSAHISRKIQADLDYELVKKTMQKCSNLSLKDFENPKIQDMLQHIQSQVSYFPYQMFMNILSILTSITSIVISLFIFVKAFTASIFILFTPFVISTICSLLLCDEEFRIEEKRNSRSRKIWYLEYLLTKDTNFKEVRLFGLSKYILDKYQNNKKITVSENIQVSKKRSTLTMTFSLINDIMFFLMLILIIMNMCQNQLAIALAVGLIRTLSIFYSGCQGFGDSVYGMYQNSLHMKKMFKFFELKETHSSSENKTKLRNIDSLEIRNLNFAYNDDLVLENINLKIKKGERVALFGVNGSGKSTLVKLMVGLYDTKNDTILFNGECINKLDKTSLYKNISVLFQDFTKYELTLRENIGFGKVENINNDAELKNTIKTVGIDFVENLNQQLGLWFDDGIQLSGGQWQKVAIGRTLFNNADIYILDEPSSALDKINENKLINYFIEFTKNKMGIFISHKISNAMKADKIVFIDKGQIIDVGTHESLLESCELYREIYNLEFGSARVGSDNLEKSRERISKKIS